MSEPGSHPSSRSRWRRSVQSSRRIVTTSGAARQAMLAVVAPAIVALSPGPPGTTRLAVPIAAGLLLMALVVRGPDRTGIWRLIASAILVGAVGWAGYNSVAYPTSVLAIGLAGLSVLLKLWPSATVLELDARRGGDPELAAASAAALTALGALGLAWLLDLEDLRRDAIRLTALALVAWVPVWFAPADRVALYVPRAIGWSIPFALLAATLAGGGNLADPWFLSIGPLALYLGSELQGGRGGREPVAASDVLLANPALTLVGSFFVLCLSGTILLSLPGATPAGAPISLIDAAFTAVSATCVTGLAVLDTPNAFTVLGQALILLQIQIGGLGIMAFSAAIFVLFGRRMSVLHETAAAEIVGAEALSEVHTTVRRVFLVTAITEGVGAVLLTVLFLLDGDPLVMALWRGVFTAISSFCNAGFALQSDSLIGYADQPLVLIVVGTSILVSGLGPPVIAALPALARRRPVSLHVQLVVWTTALLVIVPTLLVAASEWNRTLDGLPWFDRVVGAWFQAVSLRTAGFVSIDIAGIAPGTWMLMVLVMFVGGSPGSTAGGIKTTTFAILLLTVVAAVRGRSDVQAFGRRIPHETVYQAVSIGAVGLLTGVAAVYALELTHELPVQLAIFEVVSALATVGLTVGATSELDTIGKVIIMACMFAGRVGPVTLFTLVSGVDARSRMRFPEARVPVG